MMNQDSEYLANRFSADVDRLLEQQDRVEEGPASAEYGELLDVAKRLASLDLSAGHPLRRQFRQELMARYRERRGRHRPRVRYWPLLGWRTALAGLTAVLLCVATFAIVPSARTLAQETWQSVLRTVQFVRALPSVTSAESATLTTFIESPIEASSLVDLVVRVPLFLPQDYEFKFGLVSHLPAPTVSFDYGIPFGRIVTLSNGRAVSARALQGLRISQMEGRFPGPWPIGESIVEEVTVGGRPALWLVGLPVVRSQTRVTVRTTVKGKEIVEQETVSRQESPPEVLGHTPVTALMWEEGDLLLSVMDLDGRFSLEEMVRVAESLVPISTLPPEKLPTLTPWPEMSSQKVAGLEEMVTGASFGAYVLASLPPGWQLARITAFTSSDRPLERWYVLHYRHAEGTSVRLTEGLRVPLDSWYDYIESSGTLRHVTGNGLEVWTSDAHQGAEENMAKENARLNGLPVPNEVQAMFLRAPDGFSFELVALDVSWDEALALAEHLTLAPGADPALNSRLMKGCYPCP